MLSPDLDSKSETVNTILHDASRSQIVLTRLTEQVKALLDPAVASALSNAFDVRRSQLARQKWLWLILLISGVGVSMWTTILVVNFLTEVFAGPDSSVENVSLVWLLRLLLLSPPYFFVAFAISQYRRERGFEEHYAHKGSIAKTLPSYAELVTGAEVKDEITASASRVVFAPPFESTGQGTQSRTDIEDVHELARTVRDFLKRRES